MADVHTETCVGTGQTARTFWCNKNQHLYKSDKVPLKDPPPATAVSKNDPFPIFCNLKRGGSLVLLLRLTACPGLCTVAVAVPVAFPVDIPQPSR